MARVFSNDMVAHVWAQQSQPSGRSHNGNLYFEGPTLYSYGPHFPLAHYRTAPNGERVVTLNSGSYSVTTSAHQSRAWRAVPAGVPTFRVPNPTASPEAILQDIERAAVEAFELADNPRRRRRREWNLSAAADLAADARRWADLFGLDWEWEGTDALRQRWAAEAEANRQAALVAEQERAERARQTREEQRERDADAFARWRAGLQPAAPWSYATDANGSVYLRVNGDLLETSRGAEVPLRHAIRAFRLVARVRADGDHWTPAPGKRFAVGHFTVDEVTPEGNMRAGCHYFTWERMVEAAALVGLALDGSEPVTAAA